MCIRGLKSTYCGNSWQFGASIQYRRISSLPWYSTFDSLTSDGRNSLQITHILIPTQTTQPQRFWPIPTIPLSTLNGSLFSGAARIQLNAARTLLCTATQFRTGSIYSRQRKIFRSSLSARSYNLTRTIPVACQVKTSHISRQYRRAR